MAKAILWLRPTLSVEIEAEKTIEILRELAFWDNIPQNCPLCFKNGGVESPLMFTVRTPTAKQGPKAGQTFEYFQLVCTGDPQHEAEIAQRLESKGGGMFIRQGNRQDGKPNWRLAYGQHDDDDQGEDDAPPFAGQPGPRSSSAPPRESTPPTRDGVRMCTVEQRKEIERVAKEHGLETFEKLAQHCESIHGVGLTELTFADAIEYRKTLLAL